MKKKQKISLFLLLISIVSATAGIIILKNNPKITNEHISIYLEAKNAYTVGELNKSAKLLLKLKKEAPELYQGQLLLGKCYFLQDKYSEADDIFLKLIKKYPAYLEAGLWKARTEIQLEQYDNAYKRTKDLLSFNSDDPRLLGLMATIEEHRGELGRAIDFYKRASLYEEELAKNRVSLGKLYSRMGVYDKSYSELLQARELLESDSPLYKALEKVIQELRDKNREESN